MIKNSTEEVVELLLKRVLKEHPEIFKCTCEICLDDIMARTLNKVQPRYYSSLTGQAFTSFQNHEPQAQAEILSALSDSIIKIGSNPSHEI